MRTTVSWEPWQPCGDPAGEPRTAEGAGGEPVDGPPTGEGGIDGCGLVAPVVPVGGTGAPAASAWRLQPASRTAPRPSAARAARSGLAGTAARSGLAGTAARSGLAGTAAR